ncbi:invasion associated locus B family protein [Celerinatantimonas yamalensis]|uniref:Invasion associated locus B family protein n=1 Tax=Celerinatantimonas yamalensis TaxID=559956 RepID=A0ABW9G700_9GAMM
MAIIVCVPSTALAAQAKPFVVSSTPADTTATYGNWVLHCVRLNRQNKQAQDSCEVVQAVKVEGQPQPILQLAIGRLPGEKTFRMTAVLPVNVLIPGEVHIAIDDKATDKKQDGFDLSLKRCVPNGCVASNVLDKKMQMRIRAGSEGQLRFLDASGQRIAIPLSWSGFSQAMDALESKN